MTEQSTKYDVPRGTAVLTTQQAIVYPVSFIFYVLIARILSKSEIGQISLLAALLAIFTALTQLALPVAATQFISSSIGRGDASVAGAVAKKTFRLFLIAAVPGFLLAVLLSPWAGRVLFNSADAANLLVVTFLAAFLLDFVALYGGYLLGLGLYTQRAYQYLLYVPLSRGVGLVLAFRGLGVLSVVLGWATGALVTALLSLFLWRGRLPAASTYPTRPLLAFALPIFVAALITFAQGYGDIALLQALRGQLATTGSYFLVVSSVGGVGVSTIGPLSILWTPVAAALYPALSSGHSRAGSEAISNKLAIAFRLTNLVVLPAGASLAAIAPTALELAYGTPYATEALGFGILAFTAVFASEATLLTTVLQAVGKTRLFLAVTSVATAIDLGIVALTATSLGITGGALGRGALAIATVLLSMRALGPRLSRSTGQGLLKGTLLALGVSLPLVICDQLLIRVADLEAIFRLPILLAVFVSAFLIMSRTLSVFEPNDFNVVIRALPRVFHEPLRRVQRFIIMK